MPALSTQYDIPKRGTNDDFNDTFAVTATGTPGAYTCADAWGTYAGTFNLPLTRQESIFIRHYAVTNELVYWIPFVGITDAATALSAFVARRYATTGGQLLSGGPQGAPDAWQSYGLPSNATTTWSLAPNKVRNGITLGLQLTNFTDGLVMRYKYVPDVTTNQAICDAWNAYIIQVRGVYPTSVIDPIFYDPIYWFAMTTAPLQGAREPPFAPGGSSAGVGSAYIGPYLDAVKRKWGPAYGI